MHFFPVLLFASFLHLTALVHAATPTPTHLFNGTIFVEPVADLISGPLGGRSLITWNGWRTLVNPSTGNVVANLIPGLGGELGLLGSTNVFYPDVRAGL
ncbi:hypothetical protein BDZ89DRAFT_1075017 [Hymenopellis radicata]|nr:hypothetical protein BDZ89DRAFT_1075017 [Hymenopellis radicata]